MENVIRNAIRYAPRESAVEVSLERNNGTAVVEVRDHGPGVPEEALPRLFDAFYRVESESGPDGQYLAFARYRRESKRGAGRIMVAKTADGSLVREFGTRYTSALAVLPDNRTVASGHWDDVALWDLVTGQRLALLAGFGRYVYGIGISKDGRFLAAGTDDGQLQIWDVAARKCMHSLRIGYGDVSDPAFSPDGKLVAAGTYPEGSVTLVDASSGAIVSRTKISMFGCGSVAFSPDGRYLITPSNGGQIGPRQFDTGGTIRVFQVTPQ